MNRLPAQKLLHQPERRLHGVPRFHGLPVAGFVVLGRIQCDDEAVADFMQGFGGQNIVDARFEPLDFRRCRERRGDELTQSLICDVDSLSGGVVVFPLKLASFAIRPGCARQRAGVFIFRPRLRFTIVRGVLGLPPVFRNRAGKRFALIYQEISMIREKPALPPLFTEPLFLPKTPPEGGV
ncbi:hypothetical protein CDV50_04950 [Haematobacter massiliensis]|uniref:hypothetical protein n=1 Tax=Haematobacter massiliensis TaxID=195105 RepID=UPI000B49DCD8|nr:hypothetical protein [Haematobacter massiliensis]OWJ72523.1 hypothetical protein CDV50_04950 [Haematobacter massiliensis]